MKLTSASAAFRLPYLGPLPAHRDVWSRVAGVPAADAVVAGARAGTVRMPEAAWFAGLTAICGCPLPTHRAEHQAWCYAGHGPSAMSMAARLKVSAYAMLEARDGGQKGGLQTICRSAMLHLPYPGKVRAWEGRCLPSCGAACATARVQAWPRARARRPRNRVCAMASRAQALHPGLPDASSRCIPYPTLGVCKHPGPCEPRPGDGLAGVLPAKVRGD